MLIFITHAMPKDAHLLDLLLRLFFLCKEGRGREERKRERRNPVVVSMAYIHRLQGRRHAGAGLPGMPWHRHGTAVSPGRKEVPPPPASPTSSSSLERESSLCCCWLLLLLFF